MPNCTCGVPVELLVSVALVVGDATAMAVLVLLPVLPPLVLHAVSRQRSASESSATRLFDRVVELEL